MTRVLRGRTRSRELYKVFAGWIESISFVRTESDHTVFVKSEGARKLFLSIHVDSGLLTGDGDLDGFIQQLKSRFEAKSSDEATFFLSQRILRDGKTGAAIVHQPHFISSILEDHNMAGCNSRTSLFDALTKPYRMIIGKLFFLNGTTRPDIAFAVSKFASHCNNFLQQDWEALLHILRYLKGTRDVGLLFPKAEGFVFLCAGGAVLWMSKRQALVTISSTEAKYVVMSFAAREGIWLCRLLAKLGFAQSEPTKLHGDNQSAIQLAKHPAFHARTKHIGIHFHFIRDHIAEGTIKMVWIPMNTMAADVLTKGLGLRKHWDFVHAMGLVDASREGASWKERRVVEEVCAAPDPARDKLGLFLMFGSASDQRASASLMSRLPSTARSSFAALIVIGKTRHISGVYDFHAMCFLPFRGHVSKDCPVAPACKSPQGTPESRPAQASERHEIALEPHWFRVQTERIKRCNSQAKKDY
ncbi:BQ5605_C074g12902 [Microbotryum silenes-dioicae]|uniref:BQ5605_C074g12902 protein n=1 Tax=Microbotryum silenes-dioicae TaxID=796604 RepID=A0A2X0MRK3_9BASI|nr:BQ5605_C074g12902 [Microbotryum silenes-dioicae]